MLRTDTEPQNCIASSPLDLRVPFCQVITQHRMLSPLFLSATISYWVSSSFADLYMLRPCKRSEECPNTLTKCFWKAVHTNFAPDSPAWESVSLLLIHTLQNIWKQKLKICHSEWQTRKKLLFTCLVWMWPVHLKKTQYVSEPCSKALFFFKTFFSLNLLLKRCAFMSVVISYPSSFCCFLFGRHMVVQLEGEKLQNLETRLQIKKALNMVWNGKFRLFSPEKQPY